MNIPRTVDRVEVCLPIKMMLALMAENGFILQKSELRDYHFNELYFEVSHDSDARDLQLPAGIKKHDSHTYNCDCHWSTIKVIQ